MTGKSRRKGNVVSEATTSQEEPNPGPGAIFIGGGCVSSMRSVVKARKMSRLPLHRSTPIKVTEILSRFRAERDLRFVSNVPPSIDTWTWPSTVAPPMDIGEDRWRIMSTREWVSLGESKISVGKTEGI